MLRSLQGAHTWASLLNLKDTMRGVEVEKRGSNPLGATKGRRMTQSIDTLRERYARLLFKLGRLLYNDAPQSAINVTLESMQATKAILRMLDPQRYARPNVIEVQGETVKEGSQAPQLPSPKGEDG